MSNNGTATSPERENFVPALGHRWLTGIYDLVIRVALPERRFKTTLVAQATIQKNHRVLDFGVGTATLSLMAKRTAPESEIVGIDVDEQILGIAKAKIRSAGLNIHIDRYLGAMLPYPDGHFDRVISSLVFHHLTDEQKESAFREIRRVLKGGGELHLADWGKAKDRWNRILFCLVVQTVDGYRTTSANVRGMLPVLIKNAGFSDVRETKQFNTAGGTLSLYRATK
jgi:ubiquinone/menaquinone biosynthesis C-methylase UbiE